MSNFGQYLPFNNTNSQKQPELEVSQINPVNSPDKFYFKDPHDNKYDLLYQKFVQEDGSIKIRFKSGKYPVKINRKLT